MLHTNAVALPDITTMSNSKVTTDSCIPVLTGANYVLWRLAMKAFLQSTGHTWVMELAKPDPIDSKSTDAQVAHYIGWMKANDSIVGSVNMHLSDALRQHFEGKALAVELLNVLFTSTHVLFNEARFPCCVKPTHMQPTAQVTPPITGEREPISHAFFSPGNTYASRITQAEACCTTCNSSCSCTSTT